MESNSPTLPRFHQAALASAFTLSIVSPMASWAAECETPVANPLVVNIATESEDPCDDQVSLREAIIYANETLGKDTVTFAEALNGQTIQPTNGRIRITESLAITGRTEPQLTILKASDTDSLFHIESMGDRVNFDLANTVLEKAGGANYLIEMGGYGGDINLDNIHTNEATQAYGVFYGWSKAQPEQNNDINLVLKNSSISGSSFPIGVLSVVSSDNALITVSDSDVSDNMLGQLAGAAGISGIASIEIKRSNMSGNISRNLFNTYSVDDSAQINISESTLNSNEANILVESYGYDGNADLTVEKSTISGNLARTILLVDSEYGATNANILNSTISANTITREGVFVSGSEDAQSKFNIEDSILCENITDYGGDISGEYPLVGIAGIEDANISNSTLCNNQLTAILAAGGYHSDSTVKLNNTTINNNHGKYFGGGIYAGGGKGSKLNLQISNTSIVNNTSGLSGGGLAVFDNTDVDIINSTISNNHAGFGLENSPENEILGGGISLIDYANDSITASIRNTTISHNQSTGMTGGIGASKTQAIHIENSIIANNTSAYGSDSDLYGEFNVTNSLIQDTSTHQSTTTINGTAIDQIGNGEEQTPDTGNNILGVDPLLQDLALSGSSWVHQLTAESPAIGAGNATAENLPEFDQRGEGFARIRNANSAPELDMGAVQYFANPIAVNDAVSVTQNSSNNTLSVLNNDALSSNGLALDAGSITIMSHPENGTAEAQEDGTVSYTPNADFLGTDSFTYVVQDIGGNTSTESTVTITVTEPDEGGSSMNFWLLSLLGLFGLRRRK